MKEIKSILNQSQIDAFNTIESTNSNVLILGQAGTGKSTFINFLKGASKKRIICACPTAVSALNVGGQTIHSLFQIQPRDFILPEFLKLKAKPRNILNATDILIIDEISMVAPDLLDAIDILARQARHNNAPFGGIQVVGIGDVFQLPPVITRDAMGFYSNEYGQPNSYFFDSHVFGRANFIKFNFDLVYRQNDTELLDNLVKLRNNQSEDALNFFNRCLIPNEERRSNAVVITPFRAVADRINQSRLSQIPEPEIIYNGIISGNFSEKDTPAPMELKLKTGALVVFVKNSDKWHNGAMGIIKSLSIREINVQLLSGTHEIVSVKPDKWSKIEYSRDENDRLIEKETGSYKQFPLMLGYAMTIHKAQGKTLDTVVLDISRGAFAHGQIYVALSRTRSKDDIHIAAPLHIRDVIFDKRVLEFIEQS